MSRCERYLALEERLPAIVQGEARPEDVADGLEFAHLCRLKKHYATAARLFAGAFAAEPESAEDFRSSRRYFAACCAARTDDARRARWRESGYGPT